MNVIPTAAKRSGEPAVSEVEWGPAVLSTGQRTLNESATLPFVIPSEAEGSAVLQARPGNVFPEAVWALRPVGPTAKRQPSPGGLGHRFPNFVRAP